MNLMSLFPLLYFLSTNVLAIEATTVLGMGGINLSVQDRCVSNMDKETLLSGFLIVSPWTDSSSPLIVGAEGGYLDRGQEWRKL
jgi:hypothetical protein